MRILQKIEAGFQNWNKTLIFAWSQRSNWYFTKPGCGKKSNYKAWLESLPRITEILEGKTYDA